MTARAAHRKLLVDQIEVAGRRVLLRVDFNVPLDAQGEIADDGRIRAALPTIEHLIAAGASVVVMSHLGRPKGSVVPALSLAPVARRLGELLGKPVEMAEDCVGEAVETKARSLGPGGVLVLENLRFHAGETRNDPEFAAALARMGEVYVNDAFGTAHRAHASTEGVTHFLRPCAAGFLIAKELKYLGEALQSPARPLIAILGGAKVSSKIQVITELMKKVDAILVGGGMAFTFLKAKGYEIGGSLFEAETFETAKDILGKAESGRVRFLLPVDCVVAERVDPGAESRVVPADAIPPGWIGLDIGPKTIENFENEIRGAGTIVWNGPLGVFEMEPFAGGTRSVARVVAETEAVSILGGGETAAAAKKFGVAGRMTHVSTGGGASLEFLEGRALAGIEALDDAPP